MMGRKTGCRLHEEKLNRQSGQASVFLLLVLGTFLLASVGFAVDLSNMWFQRQAAQSAADSACVAGAMDMLYLHNGTLTSSPGFTVGTAGDCASSSNAALCQYAGFNGFTATTAAAGWNASTAGGAVAVNWTFPSSVTGVSGSGANSFLKVIVRQNVPTWFIGLVGVRSMTVGASCTCGMPPGLSQPPLVVLNPTAGSALSLSGGVHIVITGGPSTSIEVNSSASNAISCNGGNGYSIDTSTAGPSGAGGQLAIVGGPATNQYCGANTILNDPSSKLWKSPATATVDPYAAVSGPTQPSAPQALTSTPVGDTTGCNQTSLSGSSQCARKDATYGFITGIWVGPGTDSCPNTIANYFSGTLHYIGMDSGPPYNLYFGNCLEFSPGYYPNGIDVQNLAGYANDVAIFQPGIYYLNGNLNVGGSSTIRNAWIGNQPSTQGVMFYFLTGGPVFSGGSGAANAHISSIPSYYLNCTGTTTPTGSPASLSGNVLASQCSAGGTYVGSPSADSYSTTGLRGLLFFTAHSDNYNNTLMGAGSSVSLTGGLYFHNTSYTDSVGLNGAGGSTSYSNGDIVVDQLSLSGAGTIKILLPTSSLAGTPEVSLFQ